MNRAAAVAATIVVIGGFSFMLITSTTEQPIEMGRKAFSFASVSSTLPNTSTSFQVEVRPPHIEWWLGWGHENCRPGDPSKHALPVIECDVTTPDRWGCFEMRVQRLDATAPVPPAKETTIVRSDFSNVRSYGQCPNPMPARVPLATPEPHRAVAIVAGSILIGSIWRLRRRSRRG